MSVRRKNDEGQAEAVYEAMVRSGIGVKAEYTSDEVLALVGVFSARSVGSEMDMQTARHNLPGLTSLQIGDLLGCSRWTAFSVCRKFERLVREAVGS